MCPLLAHAEPQYPIQSENPIANFAWNENDTSRYEGHYRFDQEFATFAKISSRVELCKRLSAEFGWTVDHYALGRSTGFPTGRKNATEMYDESRHSMPGQWTK